MVRSQGLFDDATDEINGLVFRIKQDLNDLNTKCDTAQQYVDSKQRPFGGPSQACLHNSKVVSHLKTGLMNATKEFKSVLELRSIKMKDQQTRRANLTGNSTISPLKQFEAHEKVNHFSPSKNPAKFSNDFTSYNPYTSESNGGKGGNSNNNSNGNGGYGNSGYYNGTNSNLAEREGLLSASPYESFEGQSQGQGQGYGGVQQQQQSLLLAPLSSTAQYYESRETAVTEVEKTIGELGQIFNRLSTMIAQQQELVERIDEDVEAAVSNTEKAHEVLVKAYDRMASNQGLYMKIGAAVVAFTVFFSVVLL